MDQAIVGLPREIPEDRFALTAVRALRSQLIEHPELLPVCRRVFLETPMREAPAQSGFSDTGSPTRTIFAVV
jgi:hypothetical protein